MITKKKSKKAKKGVYTTNLRLPESLAELVKDAAAQNKRSMNGEIEFVLSERYS